MIPTAGLTVVGQITAMVWLGYLIGRVAGEELATQTARIRLAVGAREDGIPMIAKAIAVFRKLLGHRGLRQNMDGVGEVGLKPEHRGHDLLVVVRRRNGIVVVPG